MLDTNLVFVHPPTPRDEAQRMRALTELGLLDSDREEQWDDLARIAAAICDTPIALVTVIDADRQWFKANIGLDVNETPRDAAFCAHAIMDNTTLVVNDAHQDPRFKDNPLVLDDPHIRFYAGAPFHSPSGHRLGTVCAIDRKPKTLRPDQRKALEILARHADDLVRARHLAVIMQREMTSRPDTKDVLNRASHELNTPLTPIIMQLAILRRELPHESARRLDVIQKHIDRLQQVIAGTLDSIPQGEPTVKRVQTRPPRPTQEETREEQGRPST